jgi:hypothetical protein
MVQMILASLTPSAAGRDHDEASWGCGSVFITPFKKIPQITSKVKEGLHA